VPQRRPTVPGILHHHPVARVHEPLQPLPARDQIHGIARQRERGQGGLVPCVPDAFTQAQQHPGAIPRVQAFEQLPLVGQRHACAALFSPFLFL